MLNGCSMFGNFKSDIGNPKSEIKTMEASCIDYKDTGSFSPTVIDYLENNPELRSFYSYRPDLKGFAELFENKKVIADRDILVEILRKQYRFESESPKMRKSESDEDLQLKVSPTGGDLERANTAVFRGGTTPDLNGTVLEHSLLKSPNTFTITTGHQLNIFAGPLYFIYKIVTAIKLSRQLKEAFPDKNFVPVYWMASEDHDFAEINYTNIGGKKVHWWYEASGATGRINPDTMRQALNQYKGALGIEKTCP